MRARRLLATVLLATLLTPAPATATPAPQTCSGAHQSDPRLGPATLPRTTEHPVGRLVAGYQRFGRLSAADFLARHWDSAASAWRMPPHDGFLLRADGSPVKRVHRLLAGYELDRFGPETGQTLDLIGTHFSQRSLPPQSLRTTDPAHPCDYRTYRVLKEFSVWQGLVAPWFEQRGRASRVQLDRALLSGSGRLDVTWLLSNGYLAHR